MAAQPTPGLPGKWGRSFSGCRGLLSRKCLSISGGGSSESPRQVRARRGGAGTGSACRDWRQEQEAQLACPVLVPVTTAGLEGPHEPSRRWRSGAWGLQCEGPEPGMEEGTAGGRSPGLGPRATSPGSRRPPPPTSPKLSPHRVLAPSLPLASGKSQGASSRKLPSLSCPWPGERRVSGAWWGAWGQTSLGSGRGHIPAFLACGEGVPRSAEEAWPAARGESPWRFLLGRTQGNGNHKARPPGPPSTQRSGGLPSGVQTRQGSPPRPLPPAPRGAASSGATEPVPPPTVPASRPTALGSLVRALLGLSLPPREDAWARDPSGSGGRRVMRQGGDMATRPRASLVPCGGDEITLPAGEPAPGAVGTSGRAHTWPHPPGPAALGLGAASPGDTATLLAVGRRGFRYHL